MKIKATRCHQPLKKIKMIFCLVNTSPPLSNGLLFSTKRPLETTIIMIEQHRFGIKTLTWKVVVGVKIVILGGMAMQGKIKKNCQFKIAT